MTKVVVRYLETRRLADGGIGYYYNPPKDARDAGVLARAALGRDEVEAVARAQEYNRLLDA